MNPAMLLFKYIYMGLFIVIDNTHIGYLMKLYSGVFVGSFYFGIYVHGTMYVMYDVGVVIYNYFMVIIRS